MNQLKVSLNGKIQTLGRFFRFSEKVSFVMYMKLFILRRTIASSHHSKGDTMSLLPPPLAVTYRTITTRTTPLASPSKIRPLQRLCLFVANLLIILTAMLHLPPHAHIRKRYHHL